MLRWRGSIWKAVLKDLIGFYIAYYVILYVQVFQTGISIDVDNIWILDLFFI